MKGVIRISILSDSFDKISWNIFDWKDEYTQFLYKELINSVETISSLIDSNLKLMLTSSLELGVDIIFSHMAIDLQRRLGKNKIITRIAIPYLNQGVSYSDINNKRYKNITQNSDLIIFLSDRISAREELEKSRYWRIDNSDHIIMVTDKTESKLIEYAREKKVPIIFVRPDIIKAIVDRKKIILEYAYPLIFKERNYAGVVTDSSREIISNYAKNLLNIELTFEEDKELSREELMKKYSLLAMEIARASVIFDNFLKND